MPVIITRAQIGKSPGIDTTVMSAKGAWKYLAPTWHMVNSHKAGTMSDAVYTALYEQILDEAPESVFEELYQIGVDTGKVTVLCYCHDHKFCHTHLIIDYVCQVWPDKFVRLATPDTGIKRYAGVGSRDTPLHICNIMEEAGEYFARTGWVLNSGAARGADSAFERGCDRAGGKKNIYLPEPRYKGHPSPLSVITPEMMQIASEYHPKWHRLNEHTRRLMARDVSQVLGYKEGHGVKFVLCWTPDGSIGITSEMTGGTGMAIRIAHAWHIPIFNIQRQDHMDLLLKRIRG